MTCRKAQYYPRHTFYTNLYIFPYQYILPITAPYLYFLYFLCHESGGHSIAAGDCLGLFRQNALKRGEGFWDARQVDGEYVLEVIEKIQGWPVANVDDAATDHQVGIFG